MHGHKRWCRPLHAGFAWASRCLQDSANWISEENNQHLGDSRHLWEQGDNHINTRIRRDNNCTCYKSRRKLAGDVEAWGNLHLDPTRNCMNITSDWGELCQQNRLSVTKKMERWERSRALGRKCAAHYISLTGKMFIVNCRSQSEAGTHPLSEQNVMTVEVLKHLRLCRGAYGVYVTQCLTTLWTSSTFLKKK